MDPDKEAQYQKRIRELELELELYRSGADQKRRSYTHKAERDKYMNQWLYEKHNTRGHTRRGLVSDFRRCLPPPPAGQRWYLKVPQVPKELLLAQGLLRKLGQQ
jgi:Ni/Co efflux regulator RcnB